MSQISLSEEVLLGLSPEELDELLTTLTISEAEKDTSRSKPLSEIGQAVQRSLQTMKATPIPKPLSALKPTLIPNGIQHYKKIAPTGQLETLINVLPFQTIMWTSGPLKRLACRIGPEELRGYPILETIISQTLQACPVSPFGPDQTISGLWINLYRNGQDCTPHHQDSYQSNVMTISIGATRRFLTKQKVPLGQTAPRAQPWICEDGDVILFTPEWNDHHTHSVPKTAVPVGPRISIVIFFQ